MLTASWYIRPDASTISMARALILNRTATGAQITGRYLGLHDTATGAVSLTDRTGTRVLWSSEAGDRSLLFGSMRRAGPRKVAERLVKNLKKALDQR
jgi:hypothetical protein